MPYASVASADGLTFAVYRCTGAGGADELACRDNEMSYMFYYNLDGNLGNNKTGNQTAVGDEQLTGIQREYWSGTELFRGNGAWLFVFVDGFQAGSVGEDVRGRRGLCGRAML